MFLQSFFDRFIYVPHPDYGTRLSLWRAFAAAQLKEGGESSSLAAFDFSSLARVSEGFTAGLSLRPAFLFFCFALLLLLFFVVL